LTDYDAFASLHRELGIEHTAPSRERWARELVRGTLVDARDDRVDGYVQLHALGAVGFVRQLGAGAELMLHAAAALRAAGIREWHVDVKLEDAPAIRLSERLGLRAEHRSTALRFPWARLADLPCEAALALPVSPAEDDDLERELGLLGGQIAMARHAQGHVLRQLRTADCAPAGFAAFDPEREGARLFRVPRPALAGPLLAALRPHGRGPDLGLLIDNDDALVGHLLTHGAIVKLCLLHYAGPLPETAGI